MRISVIKLYSVSIYSGTINVIFIIIKEILLNFSASTSSSVYNIPRKFYFARIIIFYTIYR